MEGFYAKREELRRVFQKLMSSRPCEEDITQFISSKFKPQDRKTNLDFLALEAILDLSLSVVDKLDHEQDYPSNPNAKDEKLRESEVEIEAETETENTFKDAQDTQLIYDADDEGLGETLIFPCHVTFDECHPELLQDYHYPEHHLKSASTLTNPTIQIVRYPKICELIIDFIFENLKNQLYFGFSAKCDLKAELFNVEANYLDESIEGNLSDSEELNRFLDSTIALVRRLNRVCSRERKNCRLLSRTRILDIVLDNILFLLEKVPDKQHIYLDVLLKFAFKLTDYKISGKNLKQLFSIIKNENVDLSVVLSNLESQLDHHYRIMKNIQPIKSINFPTASKTAEEIQADSYISNSWHWRLRSKVIEFKRKFSRSDTNVKSSYKSRREEESNEIAEKNTNTQDSVLAVAQPSSVNKITPSWLECSLMAPLSSIAPLIQNGQVKFCCSIWMSVCGDLFVIDENKLKKMSSSEEAMKKDWRDSKGYWLRLTSKRRLARRYKDSNKPTRKVQARRLSFRLRKRKAHDAEDEEQDEMERIAELKRLHFQFKHTSLFKSRPSTIKQDSKSFDKDNSTKKAGSDTKQPPKEFLGSRARNSSQEVLMHIISFAIDTMTIEIWLNIKSMTFCARACRLAREGQTILLDQVTFPSHLEANGSWSHIIFCLEETSSAKNILEKTMKMKICVNGTHKEKEKLTYSLGNVVSHTNFACLIGCERSTFGYVWKLSQIHIYREIPPEDIVLFLLGKGPDFWSFTNFKQPSTLQLPDLTQRSVKNLLNPTFLDLYLSIEEERALNWLTRKVQLVYVAHQADYFLDYSTASLISTLPTDYEFVNSAERFIHAKILNFSRSLRFNINQGFGQALVEAGGIESGLVCFVDIIRRSHKLPNVHSLAFSVLIKLSQTNQHHYNKFLDELNGLKLAEYILVHSDCTVSKGMLDHYLNFCLMKRAEHSLIKSPKLVYHLMSCWRAWHKDILIARQLYKKLIRLLQPPDSGRNQQLEQRKLENYYINYNFKMMTDAGGIDILMSILRECLVPLGDDGDDPPKINHELVELVVNLISLLIKHPPGLDVMLDIMDFLLFLHPDPKSYVEVLADSTSYLRPLYSTKEETNRFSRLANRDFRTPLSDSSSAYRMSTENVNDFHSSELALHDRQSFSGATASSQSSEPELTSSDEDDTNSVDFRIHPKVPASKCNENLVKFIYRYNLGTSRKYLPTLPEHELKPEWINSSDNISQQQQQEFIYNNDDFTDKKRDSTLNERCSNRNFAIACIADMLASIVKLTSSDPMRILSEAIQKSIIDIRKMIILANNNSSLVREKVLRLFLYCIRACYSLNLKSILNKYEEDSMTGVKFKTCTPIQLMARQLLKYPTTIRMIQLCYGIIVGIDDFETVDSFCLIFDIETINNNLQLNTLILLINLMTKLNEPKEVVSAIKFVNAYIKQLLKLGEDEIVQVLIEHNLIDSLMRIYFSNVECEIIKSFNDDNYMSRSDEECYEDDYSEVRRESDKTLLLIVRYFIQNLPTSESIKCISELLTYFDLLNTYIPARFQSILRDRKVKILRATLSYCKLYEKSAKERAQVGKFLYNLTSLLKKSTTNTFRNELTDSQLELDTSFNDTNVQSQEIYSTIVENSASHRSSRSVSRNESPPNLASGFDNNSNSDSGNEYSSDSQTIHHEDNINSIGTKRISEYDVIERFKATLELMVDFILTREANVIPSPFERNFIIKFLKVLSSYLNECNLLNETKSAQKQRRDTTKAKCLWSLILQKLEPNIRVSFSRVILFLLSPCDSTNLDERKYYALKILDLFTPGQLLEFLEDDNVIATNRVLVVFIRELINFNNSSMNPEDSNCEQDDCEMLGDDTEIKLKLLADSIEYQLELKNGPTKGQNRLFDKHTRAKVTNYNSMDIETKLCNIWIAELARIREESRDRSALLKAVTTKMNSLMGDTIQEDPSDKVLDEALKITRDVVNDKHEQRKAYLEDIKQSKVFDYHVRQQWLSLIIGHTHERAMWYLENYYPRSWELNPVEGPSRIRRRLRPCKLTLDSKFLRRSSSIATRGRIETDPSVGFSIGSREESRENSTRNSLQSDIFPDDWFNHYSPHPLCSMVVNQEQSLDSNEMRIRMFTTDKIHFNCDCSIIRPNEVCEGEVSVASWCIHFIGDRSEAFRQQVGLAVNRLPNTSLSLSNGATVDDGSALDEKLSASSTTTKRYSSPTYRAGRYHHQTMEASNLNAQRNMTRNTAKSGSITLNSTMVEDLWFDEIVEIWDRRYQLQDVGLEIFLTNNMTYLFSFRSTRDKDEFKQSLMREQHKMINLQRFNLNTSLVRVTQLWRDGKLTNFDYLTCLNKLAGRSFNDLMQYPVFPFVLSNYTSDYLNLDDPSNFRDLRKPMAVQNQEKEATFINNYQDSQSSSLSVGLRGMSKPYHYGNHYSNSATVLHFLVRLPPFTQMLIQYQDNNFDQPDRTFHSIASTWQLITKDSNTDFKELIPEFFFLPEMFINFEQFELGLKQNNELVDDVKMPDWCPNSDPRLFTLIHRQALESDFVSENLHHWVDLIFGYKQTGKAAIEAINVFHPATYYGMIDLHNSESSTSFGLAHLPLTKPSTYQLNNQISSATEMRNQSPSSHMSNATPSNGPIVGSGSSTKSRKTFKSLSRQSTIERLALETMIKTYGQMPRQLFAQPSKQRSSSIQVTSNLTVVERQQQILQERKLEPLIQVKGLKWGSFVGSPDEKDITAVKYKQILPSEFSTLRGRRNLRSNNNHPSMAFIKLQLCLLPNGDVAIMKDNTSLMLDYRTDRKSIECNYQPSLTFARYSRRAGLSSIARMNLFSNMIISRQQFGYIEPATLSETSTTTSSSLASLSPRMRFSPESLSLISWGYIDGAIRVKHSVLLGIKQNVPLVQANSIVDSASTCTSVPELNLLLVGYESGAICAHIVSTSHETAPITHYNSTLSINSSSSTSTNNSPEVPIVSSPSGAPSAVHFLHTQTSPTMTLSSNGSLGSGRVAKSSVTGLPYNTLSLVGKTLQSVRSINKTTRWLYCHSKRINCMKINVNFGIVVTGSEDGSCVIWDLNSLIYVRTIDYKMKHSTSGKSSQTKHGDEYQSTLKNRWSSQINTNDPRMLSDYLCNCERSFRSKATEHKNSNQIAEGCSGPQQKGCICQTGINLIAISDTLGDIVSTRDITDKLAEANDSDDSDQQESECKSTLSNTDLLKQNSTSSDDNSLSTVLYCHTINGALVGLINCHAQVTAVCYSNAPEGVSVNVIVVGLADGLIRLYSSWDLSRVKEFHVSGITSPLSSILYSRDNRLLYVAYEDGQLVVLRNKKKSSITMPKEWIL